MHEVYRIPIKDYVFPPNPRLLFRRCSVRISARRPIILTEVSHGFTQCIEENTRGSSCITKHSPNTKSYQFQRALDNTPSTLRGARGGAVVWSTALDAGRPRFTVSLQFSLATSFRLHNGPAVDSASNRNEHQEYFLQCKAGRYAGLTTSCADCLEILDLQPPGTLRACSGIAWPEKPSALCSTSESSVKQPLLLSDFS